MSLLSYTPNTQKSPRKTKLQNKGRYLPTNGPKNCCTILHWRQWIACNTNRSNSWGLIRMVQTRGNVMHTEIKIEDMSTLMDLFDDAIDIWVFASIILQGGLQNLAICGVQKSPGLENVNIGVAVFPIVPAYNLWPSLRSRTAPRARFEASEYTYRVIKKVSF